MTTITAEVIADSINPSGCRLTTFALRYPLSIHAQIMTHRVFSRSAASSRARPVRREINDILSDTALPLQWNKNARGMSPVEVLSDSDSEKATRIHYDIQEYVLRKVSELEAIGVHKQHANRYLAPLKHIDVVLTASDFHNFFTLRLGEATQGETRFLAEQMLEAMDASTPAALRPLDWHIPYIADDEVDLPLDTKLQISTARSARVSYKTFRFDARSTLAEDQRLYGDLLREHHMSPFEHAAMCIAAPLRIANFCGWLQYRQVLDKDSLQLQFLD